MAIETLGLPYTHVSGSRWRFDGGSGVDGAVVYEDSQTLHSWHESDPACGQHNVFDIVRLHRYGQLDGDTLVSTGVTDLPSHNGMVAFALGLPGTRTELGGQPHAGDFDTLEDDNDNGSPARPAYPYREYHWRVDQRRYRRHFYRRRPMTRRSHTGRCGLTSWLVERSFRMGSIRNSSVGLPRVVHLPPRPPRLRRSSRRSHPPG